MEGTKLVLCNALGPLRIRGVQKQVVFVKVQPTRISMMLMVRISQGTPTTM
jgi:hypothetical protein